MLLVHTLPGRSTDTLLHLAAASNVFGFSPLLCLSDLILPNESLHVMSNVATNCLSLQTILVCSHFSCCSDRLIVSNTVYFCRLRGRKKIRQTKQRSNTLRTHLTSLHTPFFPSKGQYYHATGLEREHYANLVTSLQRWIPKASYHTSKYTVKKQRRQESL